MTVAQCAQQMLEIEAEKKEGGIYSLPPPYPRSPLTRPPCNSILPQHPRDWGLASRFPRPAVCRRNTGAACGSGPGSAAALAGVAGKKGA